MSNFVKGTLVEALLGAVIVTILLLPFQIALPAYAPYTPLFIIPIVMFFALQLPLRGLVAMVVSFIGGVVWGLLLALIAGPLISANPASAAGVLTVGITIVIFAILAVHPLLGKTPIGIVPAVLLGFVESLLVLNVFSTLPADGIVAPLTAPGGLLALVGFFAYGSVITAVVVLVSTKAADAVAGRDWNPRRQAPAPAVAEA